MCEEHSSPRTNNPALDSPAGSPSHAGFGAAAPQGLVATAVGPRLTGWPRQIAWNEFRNRSSRPRGEEEDAQIYVELVPGRFVSVREEGQYRLGDMVFRMHVRRSHSWVVSSKKTTTLLKHEQGHYDIVGLFYRDMMPVLRRLRASSRQQLARELRRVVGEHHREGREFSDLYDEASETHHGRNTDRQQAWERLIQDCITHHRSMTAAP